MVHPFDDALRSRLRRALAGFERWERPSREGLRRAAVALVVVGDAQGRACVLLTQRAAELRAHSGQWALPGGRMDPGEDAEGAARRELEEELGYRAGELLGILDDYVTRSGYRITPVALWGSVEPILDRNPAEVSAAHIVPFEEIGVPRYAAIAESDRPVIELPFRGSHLYAPTAAMLHQMAALVRDGRIPRVGHLEQPVWAWS
jgi:8-oxo-dGTP pyrophosphatase MutT (NUDIX family)